MRFEGIYTPIITPFQSVASIKLKTLSMKGLTQ